MSVKFKRNKEVEKILAEIRRFRVANDRPDIEVPLKRKDFNLLLNNIIDPMPHEKDGFVWNGIKIKSVG
jgi:hypothetical protein